MDQVKTRVISASTDGVLSFYLDDELKQFGFDDYSDFENTAVVVSIRVVVGNQAFPIRVWLDRTKVPEDSWIKEAKKIATQMMARVSEAMSS